MEDAQSAVLTPDHEHRLAPFVDVAQRLDTTIAASLRRSLGRSHVEIPHGDCAVDTSRDGVAIAVSDPGSESRNAVVRNAEDRRLATTMRIDRCEPQRAVDRARDHMGVRLVDGDREQRGYLAVVTGEQLSSVGELRCDGS